jgi:endo-1,4-beta-xylanase
VPKLSRRARQILVAIGVALLLAIACYPFVDEVVLLGLSMWVARLDHGDITIIAYDDRGNSLSSTEFFRIWRPALIARDLDDRSRFGIQHGLGAIRVAVPPNDSIGLEILWPIPGFGKVLVRADNGGQGFRVARNGSIDIELVPELARSRIEELRRWIENHQGGRPASAEAEQNCEVAELDMQELSRTADPRRRSKIAYRALCRALQASEQEVLAEARCSIARDRRAAMSIKLLDSRGRPLADTRVHARQERFDFLFGGYASTYTPETIERMRSAGLNYATLHLKWNRTEQRDGIFNFQELDRELAVPMLRDNGFTIRGHALVWLSKAGMPQWMETARGDPNALRALVKRHVDALLAHYGNDVGIWEASNEGHAVWARWGLNADEMLEVVRTTIREIHQRAPASKIIINLALPMGEDLSLKYYPLVAYLSDGRIDGSASDPYSFALELARAGISYDIVGIQVYNGAWVGVRGGVQVPAIDLFRFATLLERYAGLGKPIQITEIAAPSAARGTALESFWHAPANPQTQAEYLAGVFTIAYGNPHVSGINWWDLYDEQAFVESGGLFDREFRPKPSYLQLRRLLADWRYEGDLMTDEGGIARMDAPPGEYLFTAENSTLLSGEAHLDRRSTSVVTLNEVANGAALVRAKSHDRATHTNGVSVARPSYAVAGLDD